MMRSLPPLWSDRPEVIHSEDFETCMSFCRVRAAACRLQLHLNQFNGSSSIIHHYIIRQQNTCAHTFEQMMTYLYGLSAKVNALRSSDAAGTTTYILMDHLDLLNLTKLSG